MYEECLLFIGNKSFSFKKSVSVRAGKLVSV